MIERLSRCRVIARLGAGTDKIDVAEATRRGIVVTNVPDFCLNEQAEHTLALLLAFARRLPFMMEAMRTHSWSARHHPGVHRLAGQTLGLIGFGTSARAVAQRAAAFSLRLLAWVRDPTKYRDIAKSLQVELVSLDHLLSKSDFVSIHLPLCEETHHLLSRERLIQMKPTAVLINTARGAIVDEAALVTLLQRREIAGAALDVFEGIDVFAMPGTPAAPAAQFGQRDPHAPLCRQFGGIEPRIQGSRSTQRRRCAVGDSPAIHRESGRCSAISAASWPDRRVSGIGLPESNRLG